MRRAILSTRLSARYSTMGSGMSTCMLSPEKDVRGEVASQKAEKLIYESGKVGEAPVKEEAPAEAEEKPKRARKTAKKAEDEAADGEEKTKKTTRPPGTPPWGRVCPPACCP